MSEERCPHCGNPDEYEAQHRACRMKAAFPGAYHEDGALVSFDMEAIAKAVGLGRRVETRSGMRFERHRDGVWTHVETKVGNCISAWSWRITDDEWREVVAAVGEAAE